MFCFVLSSPAVCLGALLRPALSEQNLALDAPKLGGVQALVPRLAEREPLADVVQRRVPLLHTAMGGRQERENPVTQECPARGALLAQALLHRRDALTPIPSIGETGAANESTRADEQPDLMVLTQCQGTRGEQPCPLHVAAEQLEQRRLADARGEIEWLPE